MYLIVSVVIQYFICQIFYKKSVGKITLEYISEAFEKTKHNVLSSDKTLLHFLRKIFVQFK